METGLRITKVISDWVLDGMVHLGEGWVHSFWGWAAVRFQQLIDRNILQCRQSRRARKNSISSVDWFSCCSHWVLFSFLLLVGMTACDLFLERACLAALFTGLLSRWIIRRHLQSFEENWSKSPVHSISGTGRSKSTVSLLDSQFA